MRAALSALHERVAALRDPRATRDLDADLSHFDTVWAKSAGVSPEPADDPPDAVKPTETTEAVTVEPAGEDVLRASRPRPVKVQAVPLKKVNAGVEFERMLAGGTHAKDSPELLARAIDVFLNDPW